MSANNKKFLEKIEKFGATLYSGNKEPQTAMFKNASKHNHKYYCAIWEINNNGTTKYSFASYPTYEDYFDNFKNINTYSTFEIVPENTPTKLTFDVEWNYKWCPNEGEVIDRVMKCLKYAFVQLDIKEPSVDDFEILTSSDGDKKGSLHFYSTSHHTDNFASQRVVEDLMCEYMMKDDYFNEYFYIDTDDQCHIKCLVDCSVKNTKNRQFRGLNSYKVVDGKYVRPFKPIHNGVEIKNQNTIITYIDETESENITDKFLTKFKTGLGIQKQKPFNNEQVEYFKTEYKLNEEQTKQMLSCVCIPKIKNGNYTFTTEGKDMNNILINFLPHLKDERAFETGSWRNVVRACAELTDDYTVGITQALKFAKRSDYWTLRDGQEATTKWFDKCYYNETRNENSCIIHLLSYLKKDMEKYEYMILKNKYLINKDKQLETRICNATDLDIGTCFYEAHSKIIKKGSSGNIYLWNDKTKLWLEMEYKKSEMGHIKILIQQYITEQGQRLASIKKSKIDKITNILGDRENNSDKESDEVLKANKELCTDVIKKLYKVIHDVRNNTKCNSVIENTICLFEDDNFEDELNKTPNVLPVKNGKIIDFKTLKVRDRVMDDNFTFECPVEYIPNQNNYVNVIKYFNNLTCNDAHYSRYLSELTGYMMTGEISDRSFYIAYGENGLNGKSTHFSTILFKILNKYYTPIPKEVFGKGRKEQGGISQATPELMCLKSHRIGVYNEPEADVELGESNLKTVTGNDLIIARALHKNPVTFKTQIKVCALLNNKPKWNPSEKSMLSRMNLLPFDAVFERNIENEKFIEDIGTVYLNEVFSYCADAVNRWYNNGKSFGEKPKVCVDALNTYIDDFDAFKHWLEQNTQQGTDEKYIIEPIEAYKNFDEFCDLNQFKRLNSQQFYKLMKKKFGEAVRVQQDNKRKRFYKGLKF